MTWVWTDGEKSEKIVTTCTVGQVSQCAKIEEQAKYLISFIQDGSVTMEVLWTEDNLFNSANCNA